MSESKRKHLVEMLEVLLGSEFDSSEIVYLSEEEVVDMIINAAFYYKEQAENK